MKNKFQTASELKNSSLTRTLAHETRKRLNFFLNYLVIVAIVVSLGMGISACSNTNAQSRNANAPERWEYKIVGISFDQDSRTSYDDPVTYSKTEAKFNELGRDGWEYVGNSEHSTNSSHKHVFKRRLP